MKETSAGEYVSIGQVVVRSPVELGSPSLVDGLDARLALCRVLDRVRSGDFIIQVVYQELTDCAWGREALPYRPEQAFCLPKVFFSTSVEIS